LLVVVAHAETEELSLHYAHQAVRGAAVDSPDYRKYAADRQVQALHLALDVTPDFSRRTIEGTAILRFKATSAAVREVKLDAVDLTVHSVTATAPIQAWQATDKNVIITFADSLAPNQEATVTISYFTEPKQGLYFRTPEMGYREGDTHLFSQGEETEGRYWYPCLDSPNQLCPTEITCRVPEGMTVISNGRLVEEKHDASTGRAIFHWSQEKPHANYLVTLSAGYFKKLQDTVHGLPLAFYTPPSEIAQADRSFRDTRDMIEFFEREIGVPYPWDKYDQVCVDDFVAGGMENTSATTLTVRTLFTADTENIRNSEGLISHELAHQWFGDLVTCKDWSHTWLNEGFATYYETLYDGHKNGRDALLYELYGRARHITGISNDTTPIVRRDFDSSSEMFGYLSYPKGGWVLHMLRCQLGEDLFRRCIKTYLERHQHGSVVTDDLRAVVEELSGRSYDQFFDQWLYHGHHPELEVEYAWDEPSKLARVSIRQTQEIGPKVLLFNLPLTMRFKGKSGAKDFPIQVTRKQEDFYFPLPAAPEIVRLDPGYTLLAKVKFNLPRPLLKAQLADKEDTVGRLLAIEQLADKDDQESINLLQDTLNHDAFYGVRVEASKALRSIHKDEALTALIASAQQADARVRLRVSEDIGSFYSEKARAWTTQALDSENNPAILAPALQSLGAYHTADIEALIRKFLKSESYRNELADAAIAAMRAQDEPAWIAPLMETLSQHEPAFTSRGYGSGLETLGYLARNEEKKQEVREFLLARLDHKKRSIQLAAMRALGTLGDPRAIAALEKFTTAAKKSPQRDQAEKSVAALRAVRKPVDDFKNLRQEVLDLQKSDRDLKSEVEKLKKKLEASTASGSPSKAAPEKSKGPFLKSSPSK
jgi:aminopeptidase N